MDTKRGRKGDEGADSPRKRPVDSDTSSDDPLQTSDAPSDTPRRQPSHRTEDPEEVENRIRDTRERMSETLDEIEHRVSPDHLKHESKEFMYETVDELKREYHPQRIAKNVGTNMKNTFRKHPVSSVIAGLSVGYLLIKSGEEKEHRRHTNGEHAPDRPPGAREPRREPRREREEPGTGEQIRAATEDAAEKTQEMKEQATEQAQEMKEEAGEWAEETGRKARRQARSAKHSMQRGSRQVQREMKDFLFENPLLAGAIALGSGALLGGLLPSTRTEDEWMGEARDDVMERAGQATEDTMRRASEAAGNVADEAKSAAKDVAETSKEEAERVAKGNDENEESNKGNGKRKTEQKKKSVGSTP